MIWVKRCRSAVELQKGCYFPSLLPHTQVNDVHQEEGGRAPQCSLCPVSGGALKPATTPGLWCHATCMQWIPEVSVEDVTRMEPVSNITGIQKERWDLMCCCCKYACPLPAGSAPLLGSFAAARDVAHCSPECSWA